MEHVIFFRHIDRELRILNQEAELEVAEILKFIVRVRPDRNLHRNLLPRLRYLVDRAVEAYAVSGEGIQDEAIRYRLAFILQREGNKPIVVRVRHIPIDTDAVILLIDRLEGLNGKRLLCLTARLACRYGLALCLRLFAAAAGNERKRKAQRKGPCHKFFHIFLLLSVCSMFAFSGLLFSEDLFLESSSGRCCRKTAARGLLESLVHLVADFLHRKDALVCRNF